MREGGRRGVECSDTGIYQNMYVLHSNHKSRHTNAINLSHGNNTHHLFMAG